LISSCPPWVKQPNIKFHFPATEQFPSWTIINTLHVVNIGTTCRPKDSWMDAMLRTTDEVTHYCNPLSNYSKFLTGIAVDSPRAEGPRTW
jgi:hypothetical protein